MDNFRKRIRLYIDYDQFVIAEVGKDSLGVKVAFGGKIYRDGEEFAEDNYYECFVTKDPMLINLLRDAYFSVSMVAPQTSQREGLHITLPTGLAKSLANEAKRERKSKSDIIVNALNSRYGKDIVSVEERE